MAFEILSVKRCLFRPHFVEAWWRKGKHFRVTVPLWAFVRGIPWSLVDSPNKCQWRDVFLDWEDALKFAVYKMVTIFVKRGRCVEWPIFPLTHAIVVIQRLAEERFSTKRQRIFTNTIHGIELCFWTNFTSDEKYMPSVWPEVNKSDHNA